MWSPAQVAARAALFSPGGPMALELACNPTVLIVNDTIFCHGGLLPEHGAPTRLLWGVRIMPLHPNCHLKPCAALSAS